MVFFILCTNKRRVNSNTKNMVISGYVILAIAIILTARINIKVYFQYDVLGNIGKVKITLFRVIPIFSAYLSLVGEYFRLVYGKKVIQIKIDLSDKNLRFIRELNDSLNKRMYIHKVSTNFNIGLHNPATCSVICGYIHSIVGAILSKIKTVRPDTTVSKTVNVGYFEQVIQFEMNFQFEITLFDYVWATIAAFYKSRREVVNG